VAEADDGHAVRAAIKLPANSYSQKSKAPNQRQ
jgi:hypothetical protein